MKGFRRIPPLLLLLVLPTLLVAARTPALANHRDAAISSDKPDYHPGETANLSGTGWQAGEAVSISITAPGHADTNLSATADDNGGFSVQFAVDADDVGLTFTVTAVGPDSGTATTTFTDSPLGNGTGKVTITSPGGACLSFDTNGSVYQWNVVQGGSYHMKIDGVTECSGAAILAFIQSTSTGNFCIVLNQTGAGTYEADFPMPDKACSTYPISYKCNAAGPCNNQDTYNAEGPDGSPVVHLRASKFDANCGNRTDDNDCDDGGGPQGCIISAPPGGDLGCNPAASQYACGTATITSDCNPLPIVTCSAGTPVNTSGCSWTVTNTYTATCGLITCRDTQTFTWTVASAPVFSGCSNATTPLGCNPDPASIPGPDPNVTASNECGPITPTPTVDDSVSGCTHTRVITYTAIASCGGTTVCTQTYTWTENTVTACKFYDANGNGQKDPGEVAIPGWFFSIDGGTPVATGADGCVTVKVCPGDHVVTEAPPSDWVNTTGGTSKTVTADDSNCNPSVSFGNYCTTRNNGLTLGFWTNTNGKNILERTTATHNQWVALLNGLACLRNANGTLHTFSTYTDLKSWLGGATATNMAYMLSAQLATTELDTAFNGLSPATGIIVPGGMKTLANVCIVPFTSVAQAITCGSTPLLSLTSFVGSAACGCTSNDGFVTIANLMSKAACLLGTYNNTTASGLPRTYEECVKDILDIVNNNGNPPGLSSQYPCGPPVGGLVSISATPCTSR